jgi:hypothetical protein
MSIKITIGLILGFISFQSHSVELDGEISSYVQEVCDNELLNYCNDTPELKGYLMTYAESLEGYMQATDEKKIAAYFIKHYSTGLCIKKLYPKSNENKEITARMTSYLLYSKERFSLYTKSQGKVYRTNVHEVITSDNFVPQDCSSLI